MTDLRSSRGMGRARAARGAAFLLGVSMSLGAGPALADKVGVAAAVNPDAFSSLSSTPNKQLNIGKSIFYNERINTTTSGLVQVLLIDGSTFTVGPNSDLVIDKFVYDPNKKTGQVVATFSKGAMRFVGGKLSKNEGGVTVKTPSGALAIRGGMFQARLSGSRGVFSFLFGNEMRLTGTNGQVNRVYQPGYTIDTTSGAPTVRPTTSQDINAVMAALTNGNTNGLGSTTDQTSTGDPSGALQQANADAGDLDQLISDANATQIQSEIQNQLNNQNNTPTTSTTSTGNQPTGNNPAPTVEKVELPSELTVRVLASPDFYFANKQSFWHQGNQNDFRQRDNQKDGTYIGPSPWSDDSPGAHGILGGDDQTYRCGKSGLCEEGKFQVETDDFTTTTTEIANGRATGTFGPHIGRDPENLRDFELTPANGYDFPIFNTPGVHTVTNARVWDIGKNGEQIDIETLKGSAFTGRDGGFFAYQLFQTDKNGKADLNRPVLAFGGTPFKKPAGEVDKLRIFNLYSDPRQGIKIPFASAAFAPSNLSQAKVSPLYLLESSVKIPNDNFEIADGKKDHFRSQLVQPAVFVQTSYLVSGQGENQQSIIVLALGTQNKDGSLTGVRRGSAAFPVTELPDLRELERTVVDSPNEPRPPREFTEMVTFSGGVSTLASAEGAHLIGNTVPHIVIGADSTGPGHNIFEDDPLIQKTKGADLLGATYHVGEQVATVDADKLKKTPGDYYGFAAGIYQQVEGHGQNAELDGGRLMNDTPDAVHLKFKDDNRLSALFRLDNVDDGGSTALAFGDWDRGPSKDRTGHSAFISDKIYAAIEANIATTVTVEEFVRERSREYTTEADATTYLVSSGLIDPSAKLCTNCDYMRWGAWGGQLKFRDGKTPATADINLGWYVAGDIPTFGDLPQKGTATYSGNTIGNVATVNPQTDTVKTYIATGKVGMDWDFAQRAGNLSITQFDKNGPYGPLNASGVMRAPGDVSGLNRFDGPLGGNLGTGPNSMGINGAANGAFVRSGADAAKGVIGNWNAGNRVYNATGIFGAGRNGAINPNGTLPNLRPN